MKVAIVGSRSIVIDNLEVYLPDGVTEIVSGGAQGIDSCAREYARSHAIKLTEFLPDYQKFGRAVPLKRNLLIVDYADMVIAFWDGISHGTKHVIETCRKNGVKVRVIEL